MFSTNETTLKIWLKIYYKDVSVFPKCHSSLATAHLAPSPGLCYNSALASHPQGHVATEA